METEHEALHTELKKIIRFSGPVGRAAKHVAEVLHPHFERENELALPVVGVVRELAEGRTPSDFLKALELVQKFKAEYENMLREHEEIRRALDELEKAAKKAKKAAAVNFAEKLRLHAETEEELTYPAVLMVGRLIQKQ